MATTRTCEQCSGAFESAHHAARFCSAKCRKGAFKARQGGQSEVEGTDGPTVAALRAELEAAGRADTVLGACALALAARVDTATAVMGYAGLVKELRATRDAALAGLTVAADPVDELRSRRDRKYAG